MKRLRAVYESSDDVCLVCVYACSVEVCTFIHPCVCSPQSYISWHTVEILTECRERMGGQGLLARNQVTGVLTDAHATITADADNNVLCQKTCRDLLQTYGTVPFPVVCACMRVRVRVRVRVCL